MSEATFVMPLGRFVLPSGQKVTITREAAERCVAWHNRPPIDHVKLEVEGVVGGGKGAGWAKLEMRDDGVYAHDIQLSSIGAWAFKECKYLAPVFQIAETPTGHQLDRIVCLALTRSVPKWDPA